MKKAISVSGLCTAAALLIAGSLPAFAADVTPLVQFSDGTGNILTINGAGTYSCTGTCTVTSITTATGNIAFSGSVGNFQIVNGQGNSNSAMSSSTLAPAMDIGTGTVYNGGSATGTLTVIWTDVGFTGISPTTITPITSFMAGTGSVNYYFYVDNTNADYAGIGTTATLSAEILNAVGGEAPVSGAGITANPFGITLKETITVSAGGLLSNDFSGTGTAGSITVTPPPPPPVNPSISLSKCVTTNGTSCVSGATSVAPFVKVTYLYTVTNTSTGGATLTNVKITDDNATPNYTADDFTVCTIASLAQGAKQSCTATVYPPVTEGANDTLNTPFNYSNYHPGGVLCPQILANGNLLFHWILDETTIDNTYGTGASGDWPSGSAFSWLGSNNSLVEFMMYDSKGNQCVNSLHSYLTANSAYPSGWGTGGVIYGSGTNYILSSDTSLSRCLNKSHATAKCTGNSPSTSSEWIPQVAYIVQVAASAFGSNGFGSISIPACINTYNKTGQCTNHSTAPVNSTDTNTAVATAVYANATVTSNKATATVTIDANPKVNCQVPIESKCNLYSKVPKNCKPQGSGNDGHGYAYSGNLLPATLTCNGTQFQLGSASARCATTSTTIPLPATQCSTLKFLGSGVNGPQYNQPFTVNYTDGTSTTVYQSLSDWCTPQSFAGESVASNMPYRVTPNGGLQYGNINLYQYSIPCNKAKTVKSITCPNNSNVVVHAVTLCP